MKKTLIVLLTAVLAISMLLVSCSNETKLDEKVNVSFGVSQGRSLSSSASYADFSTLDWWYTAQTTSEFNYGEQKEWTKLENGLNTIITLSQGKWNFELCAVNPGDNPSDEGTTLVYSGSKIGVLVQKGTEAQSISIEVIPGGNGKGTIVISSNIVVNKLTDNGYVASAVKANNWKVEAVDTSSEFANCSGIFDEDDKKTITNIPAGDYVVTVWYKDIIEDNTYVIRATEPISVTVYANSTITVTGTIEEETQSVIIKPISTYKTTATGALNKNENAVVSVDVTPAMSSSSEQSTTVTIPEDMITAATAGEEGKVALSLEVTVTPAKEASSNNSFTATGNNTVAAAIDINLSLGGISQTTDFTTPVKVETYVAKNLRGFQFSYSGETWNQKASLEEVRSAKEYYYDNTTGKLTFLTDHFSTFIVETSSVAVIGDTAYSTFSEALSHASEGDTIVLIKDITINHESGNCCISIDNKNITIDGSGKTITLTANEAKSDQYGILIKGNDSSKTVTIKNAIIKTENLERAIKTEGGNEGGTERGIKVVIEDCTITTNGCGIHVKGANEVVINNTKITVTVIDNATYAAHLRTAVMVGGKEADVTVNGSTINAVNDSKTQKPNIPEDSNWTHSWCKGLYIGTTGVDAKLTVNNTKVKADFSIIIDGTEQHATKHPGTIRINSGEYEGLIGSTGFRYKTVVINGGTFSGITDLNSFYGIDNDIAKLVISGGSFDIDPKDYVKDAYVEQSGDKFIVIPLGEIEHWTNDRTSGALALRSFPVDVIKVTDDIELKSDVVTDKMIFIPEGEIVTINLNGKKLESKYAGFSILNYGTLTVNDGIGTGIIYNSSKDTKGANNGYYGHDVVRNYGNLVINGGTFGDDDEDKTNDNDTTYGAAIRNQASGTVTINGGYFTCVDNYGKWNGSDKTDVYSYALRNYGTMTITGGTVYGKMNGGVSADGGSITINRGNFSLAGTNTYYVLVTGAGSITVNGGSFTRNDKNRLLGGFDGMPSWDATNDLANNKYTINGGTFTVNGETVTLPKASESTK